MHKNQTFVIRLLADTDHPDQMRGALQAVGADYTRPFMDGQSLLVLLHDWVQAQAQETSLNPLPENHNETVD